MTVCQLQSLFNLMDLLLDRQSATGRISAGGSANVPGENGQLKSEILARVSVFGLEHTTLLRRQLAAYDAETRKIRGKKAKANFPDEVPTAQKSTLKPTAAKSAKPAPPTKTCDDEAFNHLNNANNDLFAMFAFSDKKIPTKPVESVGFLSLVKPLVPAEPFGMNMLSDQSSNTFGSSDFGWDDEAMTPDYTSVFVPNAVMPAYGEPPYLQGGAPKRMRNNYGAAVPSQGNGTPNLTQDMSGFDPEMKYMPPLPYAESSSDGSMDSPAK